jgi:magnesium transporter
MEEIVLETGEANSPAAIASRLSNERAADVVEALNELEAEMAAAVLLHLPTDRAIEVLDLPGLDRAPEIVQKLPIERAVPLLTGMSADQLADVFRQMEEPARSGLLRRLDPDIQQSLGRLLAYPEDSAGSIMTTEFVSVPANWTIEQTLDHIRRVERTRETVYAIYVLDPAKKTLLQAVTLRRLISGDPESPIMSVAMPRRPITLSPFTDREEAARLIAKYDLLAVPVVNGSGHVLGIVTVDDVIDAIVKESTEDVQRFGGMEALHEPYLRVGFGQMIQKRAGWLSALFLSEMLTASAMQFFEGELEKAIVLTLFIPLIMSSGGNSGSQATSLLIRALALQELHLRDWWRVAIRELPTGIALGSILGLIAIIRIVLWQRIGFYDYGEHWLLIAITVAVALVGIVTFGSLAGSMLPFILQRLGFDPASASAPFVATLVDVTGLVIYFGVAALILTGTIL